MTAEDQRAGRYTRLSQKLDRKQSATTRQSYADLQVSSQKGASEATLDRKRAIWKLNQLHDLGIVTDVEHQGGIGWLIKTPASSQVRYQTVRHLEAFIHGAFAALEG